ncbi:uncharacterized protein LOC107882864 [Acyrthosiphon pisum]|uniref:Odorant receptor n=1 Tax=Acyrthosiphon pisum TaxID=7029 RepID=A0A8R2NLN1_ACYPI|nr:uncharacterized protein LOC107882864 [Acyrthosiphon pisum]
MPNSSEECVMSSSMAKCTGLHYIIDPEGPTVGGHNVFHVTVMVMIGFTVVCLSMCPFGLYYWANDVTQCIFLLITIVNFSFGCFKAFTLVRHSDDICRCLDVTRFDFSSGAIMSDPDSARFFRKCRDASSTFTGWFAASSHFVLLVWTLLPFVVVGKGVEINNRDGSTSYYHFNPYNMYFLVSSETYNRLHLVFHLVEWAFGLCFVLIMVAFDTFMVTLCVAITCQMRGIGNAYSKLGHDRCATASNVCSDGGIESNKSNNEYLRDLKLIIKDHQAVLGKMNDFYKIVGPVILPQLIVASFTIIFVSFIITRNYFNGMLLTSTQSLKMCCFPIFFYQIYYTCHAFGNLSHQKNVMNFALYSSDWTQMEIKFKKLLLLAMQMHDANKLDMKLTDKLVINLELFTRVINMCYSIFSVLVNSQLKIADKQ